MRLLIYLTLRNAKHMHKNKLKLFIEEISSFFEIIKFKKFFIKFYKFSNKMVYNIKRKIKTIMKGEMLAIIY